MISLEVERKTGTPLYSSFKKTAPSPSEMMLIGFPLAVFKTKISIKVSLVGATRRPRHHPAKVVQVIRYGEISNARIDLGEYGIGYLQ